MMDSLIKMLGGFTNHEYELLKVSEEAWRTRAIASETTVALFKEIMTRDQARLDQMTNARMPGQAPPEFKPVGDKQLSSWPRIRRELEKQNRVKPGAEVPREEIERTIREG